MSIDLSRIREWQAGMAGSANLVSFDCADIRPIAKFVHADDANRAAVAFRAYDVFMRRKWFVAPLDDGNWCVHSMDDLPDEMPSVSSCPFAALVVADEWYKANIEK